MTVEQIMEIVSDYASEIADIASSEAVFAHIGKSRYAYRDKTLAELRTAIEELHRDAARYRWMIKNATWYRESDDAIMAFRVAKNSNLSCVAMRQAAIDAAMEST